MTVDLLETDPPDSAHPGAGFALHGETTPIGSLIAAVWANRELLFVLARKDFFVKYRRTSFGVFWAVGLPLVQALVLAVVLKHFVRFKTGTNFPLFVFSGVIGWNFFAAAIGSATASIVDNHAISTKIYFPRALFPMMSVLSGVYGLVATVVVLLGFQSVVGVYPAWRSFLLVPAVALAVLVSTAFALVLAAVQVYFRDVKYIVQAALTAWFYVTPVFYPLTAVGPVGRWLRLNPATAIAELFRAATTHADPGWLVSLWCSLGWCAGLLFVAALLYRRFDRVFADLL